MLEGRLGHLVTLYQSGDFQELLEQANGFPLSHPDAAAICNVAGAANAALGRQEAALAMFGMAIQIQPDFAMAHYNQGGVLRSIGRRGDATRSYEQAIRCDPTHTDAYYNCGNNLLDVGLAQEAVVRFDNVLHLDPDHVGALNNRGVALRRLHRLDEAIASFGRALKINPNLSGAAVQMLHLKAQICDWSETGIDPSPLGANGDKVPPLAMLAIDDDPERQLMRAQGQISIQAPAVVFAEPRLQRRLRIGYFSADFHNHATMSLMARMFELHDRSRIEVHAFSYGHHAEGGLRQRLCEAVEHFHDVSAMSDQDVAAMSRENGIDIAVDLKGYTQGGRPEIFAYRAAPVQMAYLGFPGTMGQAFIDYVIADRVVIPEAGREFFTEKVIYLPDSYQVNDNRRSIGEVSTRAGNGLPDAGFVFCCFNNSYKISPAEFDIWMRLLSKVDGSVFWLLKDNRWVEGNLRREAAARGIDPDRLVFADRVPEADHLARQCCADLFLDTFRYNAHTTASDALWAGLPVVTMLGNSFAARVAGSLLYAVGLPDMVTTSPEAYEQLAASLATDSVRLAEVGARLASNRADAPLFDTEAFTRHIERAYELVFDRHLSGLPPAHLSVA